MKKNISINISGIIFHIEEDAYERLKEYLDSINQYFSSFEDSQEIIADIESRIAEIFLSKLNEDKQVIKTEDVESLVTTMGSIKDFQAIEEETTTEEKRESSGEDTEWRQTSYSRKLYRDEKRKLLGGVCAGIAHYFNIDPLWIRLIFIILLLGSYGFVLIIYIIMWVVIPANHELSEDKKLKKMYRNPDGKVLGGVATGIATYFGVDVAVIRLLFVIFTLIGGTGLLAYIILWIILPEAKSITDKVQMQGEPVTLSNIESNIKKSLNVKSNEDENIFVKILLFPFRLIAAIINGLGRALGPIMLFLVDFIRVAIGVFIVFLGIVLAFCTVVFLGVVLGLVSGGAWEMGYIFGDIGIPLEIMANSFPVITTVATFLAIIIPCIFFILLGVSMVAKKIIFNASVGWSLFALFIISAITLSVNVPAIAFKFREDGEHRVTETYDLEGKTAIIQLREVGLEDYNVTSLKIRGHEEPEYKLVQVFEAQGSSRLNATENAQMVTYNVDFVDSVLTFDSNIRFKDDAIFRAQRLEMTLYVPYGQKFVMDYDLRHIIRNTIYRSGRSVSDMDGNTWVITKGKGLECITCKNSPDYSERNYYYDNSSETGYDRVLNFSNFTDIEIESAFNVEVYPSNEYKVIMKGRNLDDVYVYQDGNKLNITYENLKFLNPLKDRDIDIRIYMPQLNEIEVTGASKVYINEFNLDDMNVILTGASYLKMTADVRDLDIELTGASEVVVEGRGEYLKADITGASHLDAYNFEVRSAFVEAHGASSAKVFVSEDLEIEETLASNVKYRGNAKVRRERNGF